MSEKETVLLIVDDVENPPMNEELHKIFTQGRHYSMQPYMPKLPKRVLIDYIISKTGCTHEMACKALDETNDDIVGAVYKCSAPQ